MRKEMNLLVAVYLGFLLMLALSSLFGGILSTIVYILAFVLPLAFGLFASRDKNTDGASRAFSSEYLTLSKEGARLMLPMIFPTIILVFALSYLTSLLIYSLSGVTDAVAVDGNIFVAILNSALLPAVLEELLFRFLPMKLMAKRSARLCVFSSALFFALIHNSFFLIPYAFAAGVVFMVLDIATDSVLVSMIIHFLNNLLSVLWIFYSDNRAFSLAFVIVLATAAAVSLVFVVMMRKKYRDGIRRAFAPGERYKLSYEPLFFIIPTLFIAVTEFL